MEGLAKTRKVDSVAAAHQIAVDTTATILHILLGGRMDVFSIGSG